MRTLAEGMAPLDYIKYRYYEKWLAGLTHAHVDMGYITQQELDARTEGYYNNATKPLPKWHSEAIDHQVIDYLRRGDPAGRDVQGKATFKKGDSVTVADVPVSKHTRVPGFLRIKPVLFLSEGSRHGRRNLPASQCTALSDLVFEK